MIENSVTPPVSDSDAEARAAHEAAMIARAEGGNAPETPAEPEAPETPETPETPEGLILGKFKTQADLEKAYKELESKLGAPKPDPEKKPGVELERPETPAEDASDEETAQQLADAGVDFEKYAQSFAENDGLTEEDYAELETKGFSREVTDIYVEGLRHRIEARQQAAVSAIGSEDDFIAVRDWAGTNLSDAEFEAFNRQLAAAKSTEDVSLLYGTLAQKYRKANPTEPRLVSGSNGAPAGTTGFASKQEMSAAMRDKRYGHDAQYTHEVEKRAQATAWL